MTDSMCKDLRDALDSLDPEAGQPAAIATFKGSSRRQCCSKCHDFPTPKIKLRYCGRCASVGVILQQAMCTGELG